MSIYLFKNVKKMKILCNITSIREELVTKGPNSGSNSKYVLFIAADKRNWIIGRTTYDSKGESNSVAEYYFKGFVHLLNCLKRYNIDEKEASGKITQTLMKNTGIKFVINPGISETLWKSPRGLEKIGDAIDRGFKCRFTLAGVDTENIYNNYVRGDQEGTEQ